MRLAALVPWVARVGNVAVGSATPQVTGSSISSLRLPHPNAEDTLGQLAWLAGMERRRIKALSQRGAPRRHGADPLRARSNLRSNGGDAGASNARGR